MPRVRNPPAATAGSVRCAIGPRVVVPKTSKQQPCQDKIHKPSAESTESMLVDDESTENIQYYAQLRDDEFPEPRLAPGGSHMWKAFGARVATIVVGQGKDARKWTLHEGHLVQFSEYFKHAFRGRRTFAETTSLTVRLQDFDCDTFHNYVCWLQSNIFANFRMSLQMPRKVNVYSGATPRELFDLYHLADYLQNTNVMEDITAALSEEEDDFDDNHRQPDATWDMPTIDDVQYVYANTKARSPFRKALVWGYLQNRHNASKKTADLDNYLGSFGYDVGVPEEEI